MTQSGATPAQTRGALAATTCYLFWGLVPLYWKQMASVDPIELIAHRNVWSLVLVSALVVAQGEFRQVRATLASGRAVRTHLLSGVLLTSNWLIYVWGVNTGHVVEASLGYFLVPLVNVASGRLLLGEHLRRPQWFAITSAAIGVAVLVMQIGRLPWVALGLAASWGGYSVMRKKSQVGAMTGLTVETLLVAPAAIALLAWRHHTGAGVLGYAAPSLQLLVLSSGVITAIPLLLFAYGARQIRLSTLGLLQYVTPSVQFALGVWLYHEAFPHERLIGFAFIWAGLALYTADSVWAQRKLSLRQVPSGS